MTEKKEPKLPWAPNYHMREQVLRLRKKGYNQATLAIILGIDGKTLRKHFRKELDEGKNVVDEQVMEFLTDGATGLAMKKHGASYGECLAASKFYGQTQMGMSFTSKTEVTGANGTPLVTPVLNVVVGNKSNSTPEAGGGS